METQLGAKNQKKISNGQGCRTGTHARTYVRTHEREFIGSFRSLKTSGEPISGENIHKQQTQLISLFLTLIYTIGNLAKTLP